MFSNSRLQKIEEEILRKTVDPFLSECLIETRSWKVSYKYQLSLNVLIEEALIDRFNEKNS